MLESFGFWNLLVNKNYFRNLDLKHFDSKIILFLETIIFSLKFYSYIFFELFIEKYSIY